MYAVQYAVNGKVKTRYANTIEDAVSAYDYQKQAKTNPIVFKVHPIPIESLRDRLNTASA